MAAISLGSVACSSSAVDQIDKDAPIAKLDAATPRDGEILSNGRRFAPITSFSEAELAAIQDLDMFEMPDTLQRTAMRWRLQMMKDDMHYIEVELNFELARQVMHDAKVATETAAGWPAIAEREGRAIKGADSRAFANNPRSIPSESIGMSEAGGSGALVTPTKIYTAAHVVFRNIPPAGQSCSTAGVCGWVCANYAAWTQANGCGAVAFPRWRFGMGSGNAQNNPVAETGWLSAPQLVLLTAFTVSPPTVSGFDYAAIDFAVGTFSTAPSVGTHMGMVGISDADAQSLGAAVFQAGYPTRSNCPSGSVGGSADCPLGTVELGPTELGRPYNWGELMWTSAETIAPGTTSPTGSWATNVDVVYGQSGGPLVTWWTGGCGQGCPAGWYVLGAASSSGGSNSPNRFARVTGTVLGWL